MDKKGFCYILFLGGFLCFAVSGLLSSCSSVPPAEVYYDNRKNYEAKTIDIPSLTKPGKNVFTFGDYTVEVEKNKNVSDSSFTILGIGKTEAKESYDYGIFKDGNLIRRFSLVYGADGVQILNTKIYDSAMYIVLEGKRSIAFANEADGTMISDSGDVKLEIEGLKTSLQNGKVYTIWGNVPAGARVLVDDEEYAIIDLLSNPKILYNADFSQSLDSETEADISAVMATVFHFWYKLSADLK